MSSNLFLHVIIHITAEIYSDLIPNCVVPINPDAVLILWDSDVSDVNQEDMNTQERTDLRSAYQLNLIKAIDALLKTGKICFVYRPLNLSLHFPQFKYLALSLSLSLSLSRPLSLFIYLALTLPSLHGSHFSFFLYFPLFLLTVLSFSSLFSFSLSLILIQILSLSFSTYSLTQTFPFPLVLFPSRSIYWFIRSRNPR